MNREKRWAAVEAAYALGATHVLPLDIGTVTSGPLAESISVLLGWSEHQARALADALLEKGHFASFEKLKEGLLPFIEAAEEAEQGRDKPKPVFTDEQAAKIVQALKEGLSGIGSDIRMALNKPGQAIKWFLNGPRQVGSDSLRALVVLFAEEMRNR